MAERPNLLLFMPDQLRADAVGCFGSPVAHTPNIDALARRGTRFTNAFAQHPVCSPSRCSFMTGWYPHVSGHRTLTHLLKPHEPNLLRLLKDAGYHVAWAGKRGDTFAPGVTEASTDFHGFSERPTLFFEVDDTPREDVAARCFYHGERQTPAPVLDFDEATVRTALHLLVDGLPEPWVLFVALIFPHPPFEVELPWWGLHDPADMPDPQWHASGAEPRYRKAIRDTYGTGRMDADGWRRIVATYHGMVSRVDAQLGRVLAAIDASDAGERTATVFFTDHGEYLGDNGLVEKWPSGLEDSLVRNPLVIAPPGGNAGGATCDAMVELVDLLPTCLDWAGAEAQHTHFGRSLVPLLADPAAPHKACALSEGGFSHAEAHLLEDPPFPYDLKGQVQRADHRNIGRATALRTPAWTYVHRLYDTDQLFDRAADPAEQHNLVDDPDHAGTLTMLREQLLERLAETADVTPWDADPRF